MVFSGEVTMSTQTSISSSVRPVDGQTQDNTLPSRPRQVRYTFRVGSNPKNLLTVLAISYDEAANLVASKVYGANSSCRVKGIPYYADCCGYFQAINILRNNKSYPIGEPFHLQRMCNTHKDNKLAKAAIAG
jgi:hypothetical protein